LKDYDPADTDGWHSKEHADEGLQQVLRAWLSCKTNFMPRSVAVLLIFQGMDAAGRTVLSSM